MESYAPLAAAQRWVVSLETQFLPGTTISMIDFHYNAFVILIAMSIRTSHFSFKSI